MTTIYTQRGKRIEVLSPQDLRHPVELGGYVRAYCHIHGSDHQRSLSIKKATGWGHCFNATCDATVLVAEWNRQAAKNLLQAHKRGVTSATFPASRTLSQESKQRYTQPMLLPPPRSMPEWQEDELTALYMLDEQMRQALLHTQRAQIYLRERCIPLQLALATGVRYLPAALLRRPEMSEQRRLLGRWSDRLLFPLLSPDGIGYIGRSLSHWQPGMNESRHKALLERAGSPRRWLKTSPAGWFSVDFEQFPTTVILVEGAFDRLTLLAAGLPASAIVALVGTALPFDWLPAQVETIILALDGDEGGREASRRLAHQLAQMGLRVQICPLAQDSWGKDWNERWQRRGRQSIVTVFEAFSLARSAAKIA